MTTLVFVHGRRQHGRDPLVLRDNWTKGLNRGLRAAGMPTVDPGDVRFPFYGDVLFAAAERAGKSGADIDLEGPGGVRDVWIHPAMPNEVVELESDLLRSLGEQAGIREIDREGWQERILRLPKARAILKWVADRTVVDQEVIESFLTDVAVYLKVAREEVLDVVRDEIATIDPAERLVIVGHSLGSVVVRDLLEDTTIRDRVPLLVTAGSPLGLQAVYRNLLAGRAKHPGVPAWLTVWDGDDFVALGHPLHPLYGSPLDDVQVDNPDDQAHSISEYLSNEEVAAAIGAALSA